MSNYEPITIFYEQQVVHICYSHKILRDQFYKCYLYKKILLPKSNLINHEHFNTIVCKSFKEILDEENSLQHDISCLFFNIMCNLLECIVQIFSLDFVKSSSGNFNLWEMLTEFNKLFINRVIPGFLFQHKISYKLNMFFVYFVEFNFLLFTSLLKIFME